MSTLCVAKIKNAQIALPGDYFQRMGLGLRASRRMASGGTTRSFNVVGKLELDRFVLTLDRLCVQSWHHGYFSNVVQAIKSEQQ